MKSRMHWLPQADCRYWTMRNFESIKDHEGAPHPLRIKHLADYYAARIVTRVADEYRLASQVMERRRFIDIARLCTAPVRMHKLIEKFAPPLARGRDAKHPKITVG